MKTGRGADKTRCLVGGKEEKEAGKRREVMGVFRKGKEETEG